MSEKYEGETCEGCLLQYSIPEDPPPKLICRAMNKAVTPDDPACEWLKPSLECRKVRALEALAGCVITTEGQIIFRSQGPFRR